MSSLGKRYLKTSREEKEFVNGRRDPLLIVLYILHLLSRGPETITHVAYKANLNHRSARKYLSLLESRGFLQTARFTEGRVFLITQKGLTAMKDLMKAVQEVWAPVSIAPWQTTEA